MQWTNGASTSRHRSVSELHRRQLDWTEQEGVIAFGRRLARGRDGETPWSSAGWSNRLDLTR